MSAVSLQTNPYLSERLAPCIQHALWLLCMAQHAHARLSTHMHGSFHTCKADFAHAWLSTHMQGSVRTCMAQHMQGSALQGSGQQTWKGLTCAGLCRSSCT